MFASSEFILNKFKFSKNIYFKYIQICSFIFIILTIFIISDFLLSNISFIFYMYPDPNNEPHAKLGMGKLAASVTPSNKGNGSSNQAISPADKTNTVDSSSNILENIDSFTNLNELNLLDSIGANNLFILSPNEPNIISLLFTGLDGEVVLSSILILSIVILLFTVILAFMLIIIFVLNDNKNLNFLKNYLSKTKLLYLNKKLEIIANLIGKSYKLNILFCIFLIITFDCFIIHMVYTILSNLEVFCSNYLENLK